MYQVTQEFAFYHVTSNSNSRGTSRIITFNFWKTVQDGDQNKQQNYEIVPNQQNTWICVQGLIKKGKVKAKTLWIRENEIGNVCIMLEKAIYIKDWE